MTTIYAILNPAENTINYVCDSQETINEVFDTTSTSTVVMVNTVTGVFSIGTSIEADAILSDNRQAWLITQTANNIFSVNKEIPVEDGVIWENCDLSTEVANISTTYHVLNTPYGNHIAVIGLEYAINLQEHIKNQYLNWYGLGSYQIWTEWPTMQKVKSSRYITSSTSSQQVIQNSG
jgi:hypothetical protein